MKRIILVSNALNFKPEILDMAAQIAGITGSTVTGLFVDDTTYVHSTGVNSLGGQLYVEELVMSYEDRKLIEDKIALNTELFNKECLSRNIDGAAIVKKGMPKEIIQLESRFADLLIISPHLSFDIDQDVPTAFVKDMLAGVECPVILSPEVYETVDRVVIAYDGSQSSVFAAKQFSYLLPALCSKNVIVLNIMEDDDDENRHNESLFVEWMTFHLPNHTVLSFIGNARDVLFNYFMENEEERNQMLVAGAFGRSAISRFFRPGTTDKILKAIDIPVFIAHT